MGVLVKTAQAVENRVELVREQFEPKLRAKLRDAKAEWLELRGRNGRSTLKGTELRFRASFLRADTRVRIMLGKFLGRIIVELERVKRRLPGEE